MFSRLVKCFVIALLLAASISSQAAPKVIGSYYFGDKPFPQYKNLWQEGWPLKDANGETLVVGNLNLSPGGYIFVQFKNTTSKPVTVKDLQIEGIKMSEALAWTEDTVGSLRGASILVSKLPKSKIGQLKKIGQPVWWKAEPMKLEPGQIGQVTVRIRRDPQTENISVGVETDNGIAQTSVPVRKQQPRFASINFTPDLGTVYLYAQHPKAGMRPAKMFLNGADVTAQSTISADSKMSLAPITIKLDKPLKMMSYNTFSAVYPDGSAAIYGIRTWGNEMVYGMWGCKGEDARATYRDWAKHNVNVQMSHANKEVMEISFTSDGPEFLKSLGMRQMATWQGNAKNPIFYFLQDEPDAQDYGIDDLQPLDRLGCIGQHLVNKSNQLRDKDPNVPILLNINNSFKPENWYMYHQLSDIPCHDPYYPEQQDSVYTKHPMNFPAHTKPTYVYATGAISQSAGQPKPLHVILCSTQYTPPNAKPGDYIGRFPTPEEKRMEVYYAVAAGAKGLSYWWFTPGAECNGTGADEPAAQALWKEIGLLGAEVRTAGPVITTSCPANIPVKGPKALWLRSLISGSDTAAIIAVNENVLCDRVGTVYRPVEDATVTADIPSWIKPADVFEVNYQGIKDVSWKKDGAKIKLSLGDVDLSRFIIITSNTKLRAQLADLYQEKFAANVTELMSAPSN